ncbi:hypothetical protein GCM10027071_23190 [Microbacterium marinum]
MPRLPADATGCRRRNRRLGGVNASAALRVVRERRYDAAQHKCADACDDEHPLEEPAELAERACPRDVGRLEQLADLDPPREPFVPRAEGKRERQRAARDPDEQHSCAGPQRFAGADAACPGVVDALSSSMVVYPSGHRTARVFADAFATVV